MSSDNNEQPQVRDDSGLTNTHSNTIDYAVFNSFNLKQWSDWLNAFLADLPHQPIIPINKEEPHHALVDLYRGLGSKAKRDLFAEAIKLVFEATQRIDENKEQLYYLLHLISYTVPQSAKLLLRQRLHESVLGSMEYGKQNLQTLLLIANSKYEVDDDLVDYIWRSARLSTDYRHLLACLRILALRGGAEAYPFIENLIPDITSEARSFQLARQLKSIGKRIGYKHFLNWYRSKSEEFAANWPAQWVLFERGLKGRLLNDQALATLSASDPYAGFLMAFVHSSLNELSPSTVLDVARLYNIAGKQDTITYLFEIWNKGYRQSNTEPWSLIIPGTSLSRDTAVITTGPGDDRYEEASFNSSQENELEEIFLEISNRSDSSIARESVAMTASA
jgi:hypothetical protein